MEVLLMKLKRQISFVYLDNIAIFSQIPDEESNHVLHVLTILHATAVTLNSSKSESITNCTDYFCHVLGLGHLEVSTCKANAVHGLQYRTTLMGIWSCFGLCNVSLYFVPNILSFATPWTRSYLKISCRLWTERATTIYLLRRLQRRDWWNPLWRLVQVCMVTIQLKLTHATSRLDKTFCRSSRTAPTDQLHFDHVSLTTVGTHKTPSIKSV